MKGVEDGMLRPHKGQAIFWSVGSAEAVFHIHVNRKDTENPRLISKSPLYLLSVA